MIDETWGLEQIKDSPALDDNKLLLELNRCWHTRWSDKR